MTEPPIVTVDLGRTLAPYLSSYAVLTDPEPAKVRALTKLMPKLFILIFITCPVEDAPDYSWVDDHIGLPVFLGNIPPDERGSAISQVVAKYTPNFGYTSV